MPDNAGDRQTSLHYNLLGRTGLSVSSLGLGGGGKSCLGRKTGVSEAQSIRLVKRALELGVNFIDTSARNGTEGIIGSAIRGEDRQRLVLSSKANVSIGETLVDAGQFAASIDNSLRALGTDYIDIMQFHGVLPEEYDFMLQELMPIMLQFQQAGKIRFIGLSEHFDRDREHAMLQRALQDDYWDVLMVGYNLLNQTARHSIFPLTLERNIGVLCMFAVRRAFTTAAALRLVLAELIASGDLPDDFDVDTLLGELTGPSQPGRSVTDTAYRFCRDEQGIDSVLVGTGDIGHLEQNLASFHRPLLPAQTVRLIEQHFGHISDFSGN